MQTLQLKTKGRDQALDITGRVAELVAASGVAEGWCTVYAPHTTAAVTINEAADPDVMADVLTALDRLVPWRAAYRHAEGNAAAHVKSVLVGSSVRAPVAGGRLALGVWQGIFFMEFDGPRSRKAQVEVTPA